MPSDWRDLVAGEQMQVDGDYVTVRFANQRAQRVRVEATADALELFAVAARAASVRGVADLPLRIWRQNRGAQLVSFRIDTDGCVCATGWVPRAGLSAEEFQLVLRRVAAESDRVEFLLTGKDLE